MKKNIVFRSLCMIVLFLPVISLFLCIFHYGANIVFADEWSVVALCRDIEVNGFSIYKLFAQHNEHRIFFPQIIMLISIYISKCNTRCWMYISACFLSLSYYFMIKHVVVKKRIMDFTGMDALFSALLGFCLMSFCQYENLLWGFQIAWLLIEMSVIASLVFFVRDLEYGRVKDRLLSIAFATIATYSSLHGTAVWPMYVCIFLLILFSKRKLQNWNLWIWYAAVGILEMVLYFYNYSSVAGHEQFQADGLWQCLDFMMIQIGYIFCDSNQNVARYLGLLIIFLAVFLICYLFLKKKVEEHLIPVGMIVFAIGVMLMISIGRSNLTFVSRYTTYALMLLVGEISIIHKEADKGIIAVNKKYQQIIPAVEGMLLALCIVESMDSLQICSSIYMDRMAVKESLQNYRDVPLEELRKVFPWNSYEQAYERMDFLAGKKWNVWKDSCLLYEPIDADGLNISDKPFGKEQ